MFGSEENAVHTATIGGGVQATNAMSVQIHFSTINSGIDLHGGSGPFGGPFDVTWNAIDDDVINGGVTIQGYNGFWNGFIRNTVHGTINFLGNTVADVWEGLLKRPPTDLLPRRRGVSNSTYKRCPCS